MTSPRDPDEAPESSLSPAARTRLDRWLDDGRIRVYPRRPTDRLALLRHVVDEAIETDESLGEPELNDRLRAFTDDPATLRRYLVDHRLLVRSPDGSVYSRPDPGTVQD